MAEEGTAWANLERNKGVIRRIVDVASQENVMLVLGNTLPVVRE